MLKNRNAILFLMLVIAAVLNADNLVLSATLGQITAEFKINYGDIGLISGLFTILGAVVSLLAGYFTDKGRRKILFVATVALGEIPCFLTAFAADYTQFFILRVLTGFGVGAAFPVMFSILGDLFDEKRRASAAAMLTTAIGLGQIIGMLLGGYFSSGPTGWRLPFILSSVPNIPVLALFLLLVPEPGRGASEESLKQLVQNGYLYPKTIRPGDYLNLAKIRTNVLLLVQGVLGTVPWGAIPLFLVEFLKQKKSLSTEQGTNVFLVFALGNILGTLLGGIWGGRLFRIRAALVPMFCAVTTVAGALVALAVFTVLPAGNLLLFLVCGFAASFLVSMTGPNMRKMLLDTNVPENRGAIFSIFNLTDSVGTGIGRFVAGVVSASFGLTVALSGSVALWIPCAVVLWLAASVFPRDIAALHRKMKTVAGQMRK